MTFTYSIENNGVMVPLICTVEPDYCTEEGPSAYLTHAMVGDWNLVGLMTDEERIEIQDFYLANAYEIEQRLTNQSIQEGRI